MGKTTQLHWGRIAWGVLVGSVILFVGFALWYWIVIRLPRKEGEARSLFLDEMYSQHLEEVQAEKAHVR